MHTVGCMLMKRECTQTCMECIHLLNYTKAKRGCADTMCFTMRTYHGNHFEHGGSVLFQTPNRTQGHCPSARSLDTQRHVLPTMVAKAGRTIQQQIVEILQEQVCVLGDPYDVPGRALIKLCTQRCSYTLTSESH
jgi:hypothetical protein